MQKLLAVGKLGDTLSFDYRIIHPDGSTCHLHSERMVRDVDENGKAERIVGIEQDITERKNAEEKIRRYSIIQEAVRRIFQEALSKNTEEALGALCLSVAQEITESKFGFIGEINEKGFAEIAISNPSWNACATIPEGHGKPPGNLKIHGIYGRVLTDGKGFFTNDPSKHPDSIGLPLGHPPLESFIGVPLLNDGLTIGIIAMANRRGGYSEDELESLNELAPAVVEAFLRKRAEQRLVEYQGDLERLVLERTKQLKDTERFAAIGETAGMVGHDIRNPLQAIVSELFLARQAMADTKDESVREALESINMIQEQVDYISKIVSDLQDYARPLKPEYADVDISDLLVKVFETIFFPDIVKLKVDVKGTVKLKTDATFIKRALTNLVNNAIQAMPNGGNLELTAYSKEKSVVITVADTGEGIPEAVKPNLFKPLMTTKAKGQGLGLAVVKRLVEGLNGQVSFESQEGKGTTFIIELPVSA